MRALKADATSAGQFRPTLSIAREIAGHRSDHPVSKVSCAPLIAGRRLCRCRLHSAKQHRNDQENRSGRQTHGRHPRRPVLTLTLSNSARKVLRRSYTAASFPIHGGSQLLLGARGQLPPCARGRRRGRLSPPTPRRQTCAESAYASWADMCTTGPAPAGFFHARTGSRRSSEKKPRPSDQGFERTTAGGWGVLSGSARMKRCLALIVPPDHEICRACLYGNLPNGRVVACKAFGAPGPAPVPVANTPAMIEALTSHGEAGPACTGENSGRAFCPLRRAHDATKSAASYFPTGTCPTASLFSALDMTWPVGQGPL